MNSVIGFIEQCPMTIPLLGHEWHLDGSRCLPVGYSKPSLPKQLREIAILDEGKCESDVGFDKLMDTSDSDTEDDSECLDIQKLKTLHLYTL